MHKFNLQHLDTQKIIINVIGLSVFIITILFNPFWAVNLYYDYSRSLGFISSMKIFFLVLVNTILAILWAIKVHRTKELRFLSTPLYFPFILWIASILISGYVFAQNRSLSFWGMNATLEYSLIESIALVTFFFIVLNNTENINNLKILLRYLLSGLTLAIIYTFLKSTLNLQVHDSILSPFINNPLFTPLGHYGSIIIVTSICIILSVGLLIQESRNATYNKTLAFLDWSTLIVNSIVWGLSLNLKTGYTDLINVSLLLIALGALFYLGFTNLKNKIILYSTIVTTLIGTAIGVLIDINTPQNFNPTLAYQSATPNKFTPNKFDTTWNVVLDAIRNDAKEGLIGEGYGRFGYNFDRFKSELVVVPILDTDKSVQISKFLYINDQFPQVEEIRLYQPSSIILGILLSQGLVGVLSFFLLIGFALYLSVKTGIYVIDPVGISALLSLLLLSISFIFVRHDFILLLLFWLSLALFIISAHKEESLSSFVIGFKSRLDIINNISFLIPLFIGIISFTIAFYSYKFLPANFYLYQALRSSDVIRYQANVEEAFKIFPESDIIGREVLRFRFLALNEKINNLLKELKRKTQDYKEKNTEIPPEELEYYKNETKKIIDEAYILINIIDFLIRMRPEEYRNSFIIGLIYLKLSEINNYVHDNNSFIAFSDALNKNPYLPAAHYYRSVILLRNSETVTDALRAQNEINTALKYDPSNYLYIITFAKVTQKMGELAFKENSYEGSISFVNLALKIYKGIEKIVQDPNANNEELKRLYESEEINHHIKLAEELINKAKENIEKNQKK